mgnify:CR=1 FL=1
MPETVFIRRKHMLQYLKKPVAFIKKGCKYRYECIKISLIYLFLGMLWVYFTDRAAAFLSPDQEAFLIISTYKGWIYIIVTSLIGYLLVSRLLQKMERSEQENLYLSYHDILTGLCNRRYYEMEFKRLDMEKNLPISVVMADVDGLKIINDAFGYQFGDRILRRAADSILENCRPDDVIARWGSDEFILLLPNTTYEETKNIVRLIKEAFHRESNEIVRSSMSIGWSTKVSEGVEFAEVLKNAENDMYKHKMIQNSGFKGNLINAIISTLYVKNPREEAHSERVGEIAEKIGIALGLSDTAVSKLKVTGHLHDIGKIAVDEGILNKAGRLTESEREEIRRHPDVGYRILSASVEMTELADCILAHHERWDGRGYPRGLSGEEIPVESRIIALADSYDAMSSERPYRKALSEEVILFEIKRNAGYQFDPVIARIFVEKVLFKPWD